MYAPKGDMPEEVETNTGDVVESSAAPVEQNAGEDSFESTSFHELFANAQKEQGEQYIENSQTQPMRDETVQETQEIQDVPKEESEQEEETKQTARSQRFKEMETRNQEMEASLKKYESLNEYVEKYGDAANINRVIEDFEMLIDPERASDAVQFITELPHGEQLATAFFHQGLNSLENRVNAVNDVLKNDYGVEGQIDFDTLDLIFTYVAAAVSDPKTLANWKADLSEKIGESEFLNKEALLEKKVQSLQSKIEELEQKKNSPDSQNTPEVQEQARFQSFKQNLDPIQDTLIDKDLLPIAREFGYEAVEGEPEEDRNFKSWMLGKIFEDYDRAIAKSGAFKTFIEYLKTDKQNHPLFPVIRENYLRAARATFREILKGKSYKNGRAVSVSKPQGKKPAIDKRGKTSITPTPERQEENGNGSLRSLISEAAQEVIARQG